MVSSRGRVRALVGALALLGLGLLVGTRPAAADVGPNLVTNPGVETQSGGFATCFEKSGWGPSTATWTTVTSSHTGSYAERIVQTGTTSGDHKTMQLESSTCAPHVVAGHQYQASVWYTSTTNSNALTVFKHSSADNTWSYWTDLATVPATSTYTQAAALTPAVPAGVDQLTFGISIYADGTLTTDDYALNDTNPTPPAATCTATADICANGRWDILSYPSAVRSVHSVLLSSGKVLLIAGSGNDPMAFAAGTFKTTVWDPVSGTFTDVPTPTGLFCSGHVQLPDGNVLVMGGNKAYPDAAGTHGYEGLKNSYIFNVTTNSYQRVNDLMSGHWYPSATEIGNGDVLTLGGLGEDSGGSVIAEHFSYASKAWLTSGVPQTYSFWGLYPAMILMQDGRLFYSGSHVFGAQGYSGAGGAAIYDFNKATITDVAGLQNPSQRDQSAAVLLPPAQNQQVMVLGGGNVYTNTDGNRLTDRINLLTPNPSYTAGPLLPQGKMEMGTNSTMTVTDPTVTAETGALGKMYVSAVILPDRTVLETGGALHNRADAVFESSLYNPQSNAFKQVTPDRVAHQYHSESFLLPDGRVVSLGSNAADGNFDTRISVYSPPYLFSSSRPSITSVASSTWAYASSQRITTSAPIVQAQLIKPAAVTHQSDPNQRLVDLPLTTNADGSYSLNVTSNSNLAPPGYYMLSVVRADHVPSPSVWVKVGS